MLVARHFIIYRKASPGDQEELDKFGHKGVILLRFDEEASYFDVIKKLAALLGVSYMVIAMPDWPEDLSQDDPFLDGFPTQGESLLDPIKVTRCILDDDSRGRLVLTEDLADKIIKAFREEYDDIVKTAVDEYNKKKRANRALSNSSLVRRARSWASAWTTAASRRRRAGGSGCERDAASEFCQAPSASPGGSACGGTSGRAIGGGGVTTEQDLRQPLLYS